MDLALKKNWLSPAVIFLAISALTVFITHTIDQLKQENHKFNAENELMVISSGLEDCIDMRFSALEHWAETTPASQMLNDRLFKTHARSIWNNFKGFQAINRVDPKGKIDLVFPIAGNEQAQGLNLKQHSESAIRKIITSALETGVMHVSPPIQLAQGGTGFVVYLPFFSTEGDLNGLINGVIRYDHMLSTCLEEVSQRYKIVFSYNDQNLWENDLNTPDGLKISQPFQLSGFSYQLTTYGLLNHSLDSLAILIAGLLIAFLVSFGWFWRKKACLEKVSDEARYHLFFEHANDGIFLIQNRRIHLPNPKGLELTGYSKESLEQLDFSSLIAEEDREMVAKKHLLRVRGQLDKNDSYPFRLKLKSGKKIWVQLNVTAIEWDHMPATLCVLRDIDQIKKLEDKIQQQAKLEALGRLSGGISHDFNNLLMGTQSCVELLRDDVPPEQKAELLSMIQQQVDQGVEITYQLSGFARSGQYKPDVMDLVPLIESCYQKYEQPAWLSVNFDSDQEHIWVFADLDQIRQLFLNLLKNANESMTDVGLVHIKLTTKKLDEDQAKILNVMPVNYACLEIEDQGVGIAPGDITRIFEPFYSTKSGTKSSGLGLASVYGIVKRHNGAIDVKSQVGVGTKFKVYLPLSRQQGPKDTVQKPKSQLVLKQAGHEKILLVDDETVVLNSIRMLLEKQGFRVSSASNHQSALQILSDNPDIDLAVLDILMPGQSVEGLMKEIRRQHMTMPIIFMSGYSQNLRTHELLAHIGTAYIQKPFSAAHLNRLILQMLD